MARTTATHSLGASPRAAAATPAPAQAAHIVATGRRGSGPRLAYTDAIAPPTPLAANMMPRATAPAWKTLLTSNGSMMAKGTKDVRLAIPSAIMLHQSHG